MTFNELFEWLHPRIMVEPNTGCWVWLGDHNQKGYSLIWYKGSRKAGHRFVYEQLYGEISKSLDVHHKCRERICINPAHLEPLTRSENLLQKLKITHCKRGHAYTEENTRWGYNKTRGRWSRNCRECAKMRAKAHYYDSCIRR